MATEAPPGNWGGCECHGRMSLAAHPLDAVADCGSAGVCRCAMLGGERVDAPAPGFLVRPAPSIPASAASSSSSAAAAPFLLLVLPPPSIRVALCGGRWGMPFIEAYRDTKQEKYLAVAKRAGDWYAQAQRSDGGMFRASHLQILPSSFLQIRPDDDADVSQGIRMRSLRRAPSGRSRPAPPAQQSSGLSSTPRPKTRHSSATSSVPSASSRSRSSSTRRTRTCATASWRTLPAREGRTRRRTT